MVPHHQEQFWYGDWKSNKFIMNNDDQLNNRYKWLTTRLIRFVAIVSLAIAIGGLILSIKFYFEGSFLRNGDVINPNPKAIEGMIKMIRAGCFGIIPAMSALLFINSLLLWISFKKIDPDVNK
jgi:hypothetical protein